MGRRTTEAPQSRKPMETLAQVGGRHLAPPSLRRPGTTFSVCGTCREPLDALWSVDRPSPGGTLCWWWPGYWFDNPLIYPREPFGFENRGHIAQDLVFAFRSPNHFFEAIWCFHACRCEFSRFSRSRMWIFTFSRFSRSRVWIFTFFVIFTLQGVKFHVFTFFTVQGVNFHVFRDFHAPRCEFPRFSRLSPRSKFFRCQPQKQKPYFGDPRSHGTRKNTGSAPKSVFTRNSRAREFCYPPLLPHSNCFCSLRGWHRSALGHRP